MPPVFDPPDELLPRRIYVLVKCGRDYLVPYGAAAWTALRQSGDYGEDFFPFLERFLRTLRGPEWPAGSYFPGGWYRVLKARGDDLARIAITPPALGPFYGDEVRVDAAGVWTIGRKIITGAVLQFFLRNLHYDPELERYVIRYPLETHVETRYIHHEALPFRILAVDDPHAAAWVLVNDGTRERLRWDTLRMDAAEGLYCAIRPERLPARFADGPRFRVLDCLEEHAGQWTLRGPAGEQVLALHAPWPGAASLVPLPPADSPAAETGSTP